MESTDKTLEAMKGQAIIKVRENRANYVIHRCAKGYNFKLQALIPEIKYELLLEYKKNGDIIIRDENNNKLETISTTIIKPVKKSGKGKKSSYDKATSDVPDTVSGEVLSGSGDEGSASHTEVDEGETTDVQSETTDTDV